MENLPYNPIGKIVINNIYEYYDEPMVFSFYSQVGNLYLANLIDMEDEYIWTYLPITNKELLEIESNSRTLYDLYKNSTSSFYYLHLESEENDSFSTYDIRHLPDDFLPDEDSYIDIMSERKSGLQNIELIEDTSVKSNRYVVDLSLEINDSHSTEIDTRLLGTTLINFQDLVQSVGASNKLSKMAPIPDNVKLENKLSVTDTYAASFGVRMESNILASILQDDPIKYNIEQVINMLNSTKDYESSLKDLEIHSEKSKFKLLSLLKTMHDNKIGGNITLGSPSGKDVKIQSATFNKDNIKNYYELANKEFSESHTDVELEGTLLAFDSKSSTFKFSSKESDYSIIYSGKLSDDIKDSTSSIPMNGIADILITTKTKTFTGEQTYKYKLLHWEPKINNPN